MLGITYIDFMAVLVIWYGDLPREEIWFVARDRLPWTALAVAAFILASLLPIFALLLSQASRKPRGRCAPSAPACSSALRCYDAYLIAPPSGARRCHRRSLAIIGIGLALARLLERLTRSCCHPRRPPMPAEEHIALRAGVASGRRCASSLWCAIAALVLLAGAIGGLYAVYQPCVSRSRRAGTASLSAAARAPRKPTPRELQRLAAEQQQRLEHLALGRTISTRSCRFRSSAPCRSLAQRGGDAYAPLLPPQPALSSPTAAAQRDTPSRESRRAGSGAQP